MTRLIAKILLTLIFGTALFFTNSNAAALTVNDNAAGNVCNQKLSLREATELAGTLPVFTRNLTDGEKNQISGATWALTTPSPFCTAAVWRIVELNQIGGFVADDIVFSNDVTIIRDWVYLDNSDDVNGLKPDGSRVILDGTGVGNLGLAAINMFAVNSGSQIRNLEIRNFQGPGIRILSGSGAIFEGLEIHHNTGSGIVLDFNSNIPENNRNVTIGGTQPQHRNLIYSNGGNGIEIEGHPTLDRATPQNIKILNNYIGTRTGSTDDGNGLNGIMLHDTFGVIVGDSTGLTRNVISGNGVDGVNIIGAAAVANEVFYNFIGTDLSGGAALGNSGSGVSVHEGAGNATNFTNFGPNRIGKPGFPNIISANGRGVFISDGNTARNFIQSNNIGTNVGGNADLGNIGEGIYVGLSSSNNRIGGNGSSEGNLIAFNSVGIKLTSGTGNTLRRNRLFSNDGLGIDIDPAGVTGNDTLDADTGPNNLQNTPVITYINAQSSSVRIMGTLNSVPNQTFTLEFFGNSAVDPTGYGEGRNFLGETAVTTNSSGNANFDVTLAVGISTVGSWVTATATDNSGNTSEQSQARNICADLRFNPTSLTVPSTGGSKSFTVVNSAGCSFTASSNSSWITNVTKSGSTVTFNAMQNFGLQRTGSLTITYNNGTSNATANISVTQLTNNCVLTLVPASVNSTSGGGNVGFSVSVGAGCGWTATSNAPWLTVMTGSSGMGTGSVSVLVASNAGVTRTGTVTITGTNSTTAVFTVTQGSGCTFTVTPANPTISGAGGALNLNVSASSSGCPWTAASNAPWITVMSGLNGVGTGSVTINVAANPAASRSGTLTIGGATVTVSQGPSTSITAPFDFDGDRKTDLSIFRPSAGEWWYLRSTDGLSRTESFGLSTDKLVPADFTGDDIVDIAFWRPSSGEWFILRSENGMYYSAPFGISGDVPVPGDYDGDGRADLAVFRPSDTTWYVQRSSDGQTVTQIYGLSTDKPVAADYDGDGKTDFAVFRPSVGEWRYLRSTNGVEQSAVLGSSTEKPVAGDYTGDGKADFAVWNPLTGVWTIRRSENGTNYTVTFGVSGDIPTPGDYDGDGRIDQAVFRPSSATWYLIQSQAGSSSFNFGLPTDIPVPNAFVP